jgi:hypothetical protein
MIDIFDMQPLFDNGELAEEREANKCRNPECGCLFARDGEFCSEECEEDFERNKKFEADNHFALDYDENQND